MRAARGVGSGAEPTRRFAARAQRVLVACAKFFGARRNAAEPENSASALLRGRDDSL